MKTNAQLEAIKEQREYVAMKKYKKHEVELSLDEMKELDAEYPGWSQVYTSYGDSVEVTLGGTRVRDAKTKKEIKIYYPNKGYAYIIIKGRFQSIHQLVAWANVANTDPWKKHDVNHIDGNKQNNCYLNLEWVTRGENIKHAYSHDLRSATKGEASAVAKYTDNQVREVCEYLSRPEYVTWTSGMIGEATGLPATFVQSIYERKRRTNVSSEYTFLPRDPKAIYGHPGESSGVLKYKDADVEKLCYELDKVWKDDGKLSKATKLELAEKYKFPATFVKAVWQGETRTYLSENHEFYKEKYGSKEE